MGQSQSSNNRSRGWWPHTATPSADQVIVDTSNSRNSMLASAPSGKRRTSRQPTLSKSSRTSRRTRAVRNSILNFVRPKTASQAENSRVHASEEDGSEAGESSGLSDSPSSRRRSILSRRTPRTPSGTIIDDEAASMAGSAPGFPKPTSSSPSSSGSAVPPETDEIRANPSIFDSSDSPMIVTRTMSAEPDNQATPAASIDHPTIAISSQETADDANPIPINEAGTLESTNGASTDNINADPDASTSPSTSPSAESPTAPALSTAPISPARQQFPPAGTLVVVQGVVHTTDIPLAAGLPPQPTQLNPSLTPAEPPQNLDELSSSRGISRLSSLLRRSHDSRSGSRPASVASVHRESHSSNNQVDFGDDVRPALHEDSNASVYEEPEFAPSPLPPSNPAPQSLHQQDITPGSISSSSIDVLGTLLSVAAAATAASLLTSSIDSASSTGQSYSPPVTASTPLASSRTNSPSSMDDPVRVTSQSRYPNTSIPTSNLPSSTRLSPNQNLPDSIGDGDRAERMRQVWSTVRNRLGLGHSHHRRNRSDSQPFNGTLPLGPDSFADPTSAPEERRAAGVGPFPDARDARERMLSEIAGAFNLGLASSPHSATPGNSSPAESLRQASDRSRANEGVSDAVLPSEGTFERFLVDLQVDLRSVLTGDGTLNQQQRHQPAQNPQEAMSEPSFREPEPEPEDDDEADTASPSESGHVLSAESEAYLSSQPSGSSPAEPITHELSDSSASFTPPARDEAASGPSNPRQRTNFWRVYRFPPVPAPRAHAAAESVAQNMRSGLGGLTSSPPIPISPQISPFPETPRVTETETEVESEAPRSEQADPSGGNTNLVVPVIVVGLQSVSSAWTVDSIPVASPPGDAGTPAGSRWPSQATNALRTLRRQSTPAPRSSSMLTDAEPATFTQTPPAGMTSQGTQTTENRGTPILLPDLLSSPGSRTFLIYVIGGYYPPDHEIVTGESNVLDSSFEALLSLHDLFNHPPFETAPTASKEQLEKSGLEIIQGTQIQDWEKAGKVRANCVDRCLICLDEYAEQDSLRVLECKHAFHMDCVDKWLLEGRNSCPACRSKGVSEGGEVHST